MAMLIKYKGKLFKEVESKRSFADSATAKPQSRAYMTRRVPIKSVRRSNFVDLDADDYGWTDTKVIQALARNEWMFEDYLSNLLTFGIGGEKDWNSAKRKIEREFDDFRLNALSKHIASDIDKFIDIDGLSDEDVYWANRKGQSIADNIVRDFSLGSGIKKIYMDCAEKLFKQFNA